MRTKALMLTAALSAASLTSFAQVYSVNVVGYVNQTVPANGWAILANPLNNGANAINDVVKLPDGSDGVTIYRFDDASKAFKDPIQFLTGFGWFSASDPNPVLAPGEGFFINNVLATPITITFVGEVPQGQGLTVAVPGGQFSMKSSIVPQAARLGATGTANTLEFPAADGDTIYQYDSAISNYKNPYQYLAGFGWFSPDADTDVNGPMVPVGTGFWVQKAGTGTINWTRNFTVQ